MVHLELLAKTYGYWALLLGMFVEGETLLVVCGFLAHRGYMNLFLVILVAFLGSTFADQIFFFIGRSQGRKLLDKYPRMKVKISRVRTFLERHENPVLFLFRFAYGFRIVTPLALGAGKVKAKKFVIINMISALVWATTFALVGYFLGVLLETLFGRIRHIEHEIILVILVVGVIYWSLKLLKKKY